MSKDWLMTTDVLARMQYAGEPDPDYHEAVPSVAMTTPQVRALDPDERYVFLALERPDGSRIQVKMGAVTAETMGRELLKESQDLLKGPSAEERVLGFLRMADRATTMEVSSYLWGEDVAESRRSETMSLLGRLESRGLIRSGVQHNPDAVVWYRIEGVT